MDRKHDLQLEIVRVLDAPRQYVWEAWTEAERLNRWWGPKGAVVRTRLLELEPGGMFLYSTQARNGEEMWGRCVYRQIDEPSKLIFVNSFCNTDGNIIPAPHSTTWPLEILHTVTLTEANGKTTMTLRCAPVEASADGAESFASGCDALRTAINSTFDQLEHYLVKG